jgi:hypothetical protein
MRCAGPWAPLKFILEGEIAPYGVLAMTVFGCMFASLTEWPGQMTQVGLICTHLLCVGHCLHCALALVLLHCRLTQQL